jgi:hypothetical protein
MLHGAGKTGSDQQQQGHERDLFHFPSPLRVWVAPPAQP